MRVEACCLLTLLVVAMAVSGWPMTPSTVVPARDVVGGQQVDRRPMHVSLFKTRGSRDMKGAGPQQLSAHQQARDLPLFINFI